VERPQDDLCGFAVGARIGAAFLPSKDSVATLLATFTELALGFVVRPHGALFWGWQGAKGDASCCSGLYC